MNPQIHKHKLVTQNKLDKSGTAATKPVKKRRFHALISVMKELEELHRRSLTGVYRN